MHPNNNLAPELSLAKIILLHQVCYTLLHLCTLLLYATNILASSKLNLINFVFFWISLYGVYNNINTQNTIIESEYREAYICTSFPFIHSTTQINHNNFIIIFFQSKVLYISKLHAYI